MSSLLQGAVATFHLVRNDAPVAEGVQFSDGTVVVRWVVGEHNSNVVVREHWNNIEDALAIHNHDGETKVVWE